MGINNLIKDIKKATKGKMDYAQEAEIFINDVLRIAQERNLSANDVKLSMQIIERVIESSEFRAEPINLSFSKDDSIGFYFSKFWIAMLTNPTAEPSSTFIPDLTMLLKSFWNFESGLSSSIFRPYKANSETSMP